MMSLTLDCFEALCCFGSRRSSPTTLLSFSNDLVFLCAGGPSAFWIVDLQNWVDVYPIFHFSYKINRLVVVLMAVPLGSDAFVLPALALPVD